MPNCKNCGLSIQKGLDFCSEACIGNYKAKTETSHPTIEEYKSLNPKRTPHAIPISIGNVEGIILGSGSLARSRNIDTIRQLLDQGLSPEQILSSDLELYLKPVTIQDYIRIALKYAKKG
jgi:hypothetical protein